MNHRYDFIYLFDVKDANPNGDPDAGNLPRIDPETNHGLITDVCLKRKVRNFVRDTKGPISPHEIYFADGAVLNDTHRLAYDAQGLKPEPKKMPKDVAKARELTAYMCRHFYDIRAFGAVMSTDVNCGQVRGPVQLAFARSIDPIFSAEHAITRSSVTNEVDREKERTMGRKFTVPYALYRTHGFVNPFLAQRELANGTVDGTQFSEGTNCGMKNGDDGSDLELLFTALENAFQLDPAAARGPGSMAPRALLIFRHDDRRGRALSHTLFERLRIDSFEEKKAEGWKPPRSFEDYKPRITFDGKSLDEFFKAGPSQDLGNGVTLIRRI